LPICFPSGIVPHLRVMSIPPGVKLKVDRAIHHIDELHAAMQRWHDSGPYSVVRETDPKTGDYSFRLQIQRQIPFSWAASIGDTFHNLRSALNHSMVQLVMANGGTVTKTTEFPVFQNVQAYNAKAAGKVLGASQQAIDLIDAAKPYKGGNDGLWQIHELDIIDKHRALVPAFGSYTALTIDPVKMLRATHAGLEIPEDVSLPLSIRPANRCPLEDGQELYRVPADQIGKVDDDPSFRIEVAINEPGVLECEPIFPALGDFVELVKGVITILEPHFL
jgi:hypothetical protein